MNFEIPEGLTDLLQEFTVSVLREKPSPTDLVQFAADYFNKLNNKNNDDKTTALGKQCVHFIPRTDDDTESMETEDDEESSPSEIPPQYRNTNRRKSVASETYDPEADDDEDDSKPVQIIHPKSDEQRKRLSDAVRSILLFRALDSEQISEVLDAMFEVKVQPGHHVIDQGDDGDNFYVIDSGRYDIFVNCDGKDKKMGAYDGHGSFGELALMYNLPRSATIVATSPGTLWAMDRGTFRRIVLKNAFMKRKLYESLLENVPMLKALTVYERMNVADALVSREYQDGQQIIKEGDAADCMFFVEEGEARVGVMDKDDDGGSEYDKTREVELKRYSKGDYFGELALVTHNPRAASVYSVGRTKCAVLDVGAFERLLGPCMDIMKRNINEYEEQLESVFNRSELSGKKR
ncbi:cAMP-dependent protein kinase type II regulatory subunit-like isoform X3 [Gigantopelta aegis]|uniref:cAMP-dependent protein kinase type II regulatory subunit-like isoform X3 n=1 Tax=Gigantopelta aegis TaxID=1735272 RepID=UPI001B88B9BE|nr:cAMP-dependent protein kinase type II regulatory subunit-like isoform X3 [Gigantopelta aegis]